MLFSKSQHGCLVRTASMAASLPQTEVSYLAWEILLCYLSIHRHCSASVTHPPGGNGGFYRGHCQHRCCSYQQRLAEILAPLSLDECPLADLTTLAWHPGETLALLSSHKQDNSNRRQLMAMKLWGLKTLLKPRKLLFKFLNKSHYLHRFTVVTLPI